MLALPADVFGFSIRVRIASLAVPCLLMIADITETLTSSSRAIWRTVTTSALHFQETIRDYCTYYREQELVNCNCWGGCPPAESRLSRRIRIPAQDSDGRGPKRVEKVLDRKPQVRYKIAKRFDTLARARFAELNPREGTGGHPEGSCRVRGARGGVVHPSVR